MRLVYLCVATFSQHFQHGIRLGELLLDAVLGQCGIDRFDIAVKLKCFSVVRKPQTVSGLLTVNPFKPEIGCVGNEHGLG